MNHRFWILPLLSLALSSGVKAETKAPSDAEQVAGLQKMCADNADAIRPRQEKKSLYDRLGKHPRIKTLAGKIFKAHSTTAKIGHMFAKVDRKNFVKHVAEFLVAGTGGKGTYTGKDMMSVHRDLNITNADFLSAGGDVGAVMKEMKYGENETQEVVCALVSFVPVVVKQ
jgi:hemoglobin